MHTLFLLRHAQPAPTAPQGGTDHDRPLTELGRRQAGEVGRTLAMRGVGHALVSSALRTRQTFEETGLECPVEVMKALYYCSTDTMRQRISEIDDDVETLLVVGHAPTIPALAAQLAAADDPAKADEMGCWYPPATLTEIALDAPWQAVVDEDCPSSLRGVQRPQ